MITFILLFGFLVLAIVLGVVASSANQRKRAGQAEVPAPAAARPTEGRAAGKD